MFVTPEIIISALLAISLKLVACSKDEISNLTSDADPTTSAQLSSTDIIKEYFNHQGLSISLEPKDYNRYDKTVVAKMSEFLQIKKDFVRSYELNSAINSMIHESIVKQLRAAEQPFGVADEAILQALDLIVPNTDSQPIFELAKKDLRQFFIEQPDRGREILAEIGSLLDTGELHTMNAIEYLEQSYHNWMALGRLIKYIEDNGKASTDSKKELINW